MLDTVRIYKQLTPALQQRLTQLALLQQRTALLARMPAMTLTKGKPVRWAATPAPLLLHQVKVLAADADYPKLSALILRNWFQHKMELYYQVRRSLMWAYLLPISNHEVLPEPANAVLRLPEKYREPATAPRFYTLDAKILPECTASPEEVTLMAELLGWSVGRPALHEVPADGEHLDWVRMAYQTLEHMHILLDDVLTRVPATEPAALLVAQGEIPTSLDPATEQGLNWGELYPAFRRLYNNIFKATTQPAPSPDAPMRLADLEAAVDRIETITSSGVIRLNAKAWLVESLGELLEVCHIHQPDFAPVAALHTQARELRARVEAEDPQRTNNLAALMRETSPLLALIEFINSPSRLDQTDKYSKRLQELEAVVAPALFNALLLRKLKQLAPAPNEPA